MRNLYIILVALLACAACAKEPQKVDAFEEAVKVFEQRYAVQGWYNKVEAPVPHFVTTETEDGKSCKLIYASDTVSYKMEGDECLVHNNSSKGKDLITLLYHFGLTEQSLPAEKQEIIALLGAKENNVKQVNKKNVAFTAIYHTVHGADVKYTIADRKLKAIDDSTCPTHYISKEAFVKLVNAAEPLTDKVTLWCMLKSDKAVVECPDWYEKPANDEAVVYCRISLEQEKILTDATIKEKSNLLVWLLIGCGAVLLIIGIGVLIWALARNRKSKKEETSEPTVEQNKGDKTPPTPAPAPIKVEGKIYTTFDELVKANDISVESVLAVFDRMYGKKLSKSYHDQNRQTAEQAKNWRDIEACHKSGNGDIVASMLEQIDAKCNSRFNVSYGADKQRLAQFEDIKNSEDFNQLLTKFDALAATNFAERHKPLMDELAEWRELPKVSVLENMLAKYDILARSRGGHTMSDDYNRMKDDIENVDRKLGDYNSCCDMFVERPINLKGALKSAIQQYNQNQTIEGAVAFATKFKGEKENISSENVLHTYNEINGVLSRFKLQVQQLCEGGDLKLKDRYELVMSAVEAVFPLLKIMDVNCKSDMASLLENLKSDFARICVIKAFMQVANNSGVGAEAFDQNWADEIEAFNQMCKNNHAVNIAQAQQSVKPAMDALLSKVKRDDFMLNFIDKMWERFVERFFNSITDNGVEREALLEEMFNIAFHTADLVKYFKQNVNIINVLNLELLLNDFKAEKSTCYEFVYNHLEKSNNISNQIYELAKQLGVKNLDVVVSRYKLDKIS